MVLKTISCPDFSTFVDAADNISVNTTNIDISNTTIANNATNSTNTKNSTNGTSIIPPTKVETARKVVEKLNNEVTFSSKPITQILTTVLTKDADIEYQKAVVIIEEVVAGVVALMFCVLCSISACCFMLGRKYGSKSAKKLESETTGLQIH
jgi:hypothetical protein